MPHPGRTRITHSTTPHLLWHLPSILPSSLLPNALRKSRNKLPSSHPTECGPGRPAMDLPTESIIDWLPPEILTIIFLLCSRRDQISLCQTSKLFDDIGASIFYRKIRLPLSKELCQALYTNPQKACAVRRVTVLEPYPYPLPTLVPALNTSLALALKCLTKVEKLSLDSRLFIHAYDEMLRDASFPMLRSLAMDVKYIDTLLLWSFLNRHPCITKLTLNGFTNFFGPIALPNARYLKASSSFFRSLDGQVPISTAIVSWDQRDKVGEFCSPLAALAQHSGDTLTSLTCKCVGAVPSIIQGVAEYLPNIRMLHISSYTMERLRSKDLDTITGFLGRLSF
ncbi:hypothetical protein BD779DRAFT_1804561 [Infundibulicybe gibba]|nr:hypothetical protein BD779DRAFT_1804561 [Infundibulicybe gibba]